MVKVNVSFTACFISQDKSVNPSPTILTAEMLIAIIETTQLLESLVKFFLLAP